MIAGLIGLVGTCLWLLFAFLISARFFNEQGNNFAPLVVLLCTGLALLLFWIIRFVFALRKKNRIALLLLGMELAVATTYFVLIRIQKPMVYRIQANQAALEQVALSAPMGEFKMARTIGSFPVQSIVRKKNTVWFECWKGMFGPEGVVYSPTPDIPNRIGFECAYNHIVGNWYFWYEDQF